MNEPYSSMDTLSNYLYVWGTFLFYGNYSYFAYSADCYIAFLKVC